jgi:transposase-like protein
MRASKFSDAQKAFIIKQGEDGMQVVEICRKAGISQATRSQPVAHATDAKLFNRARQRLVLLAKSTASPCPSPVPA